MSANPWSVGILECWKNGILGSCVFAIIHSASITPIKSLMVPMIQESNETAFSSGAEAYYRGQD